MRFYRPLGQISALTFDLDDTLYDNRPVILRTEQESLAFVQNYHPALKTMQNKDFQKLRQSLRETEPEIYHDVTEWRRRAVEQAMLNAGLSAQDAATGAEAAMENFAKWRSRIGRAAGDPRHAGEARRKVAAGGHHQRQRSA